MCRAVSEEAEAAEKKGHLLFKSPAPFLKPALVDANRCCHTFCIVGMLPIDGLCLLYWTIDHWTEALRYGACVVRCHFNRAAKLTPVLSCVGDENDGRKKEYALKAAD